MKKFILGALLILPVASTMAADCSKAETQMEMNECAAGAYNVADKALNSSYRQVLKRMSGEQKTLLQTAQRRWIAWRDADCEFITSATRGGSIHPMLISQCLQNKTEQRTKELQSLLNCEEGDLSCPR